MTYYLRNRSENASFRGLIPIQNRTADQADQAHSHGGGGDAETDVHAGVSLNPNEEREGDELADGEGEVRGIEVSGELLRVLLWVKLVGAMGDHVRFDAATAKRHQVECDVEYERLETLGLLAAVAAV